MVKTAEELELERFELDNNNQKFEIENIQKRYNLDSECCKQEVVRRGIETLLSVIKGNSFTNSAGSSSLSKENVDLANKKLKTFIEELKPISV